MSLTGKYIVAIDAAGARAAAQYGNWFRTLDAARLQAANSLDDLQVFEVTVDVVPVGKGSGV